MILAGGPQVIILTPTGVDGEVTRRVLAEAKIPAVVCASMHDVCAHFDKSAGVLLIAEEALDKMARTELFQALEAQPAWSDIPLIVITGEGELSSHLPQEVSELTARANLTLLERPVRVATLMTVLRSGLRARQRQFEISDALEAIRRAREEADAANRAKGDFLTTMSHELRTPLNAIAGYAEILNLEIAGPLTERQRQYVHSIATSERHLLGLINDVLNFAKLEAGHVSFDVSAFDLASVIASLEDFVRPQLSAKGLQYSARAAQLPLVCGDEDKVRQIMLNLLSNAIKFTAAGGSIDISARSDGDFVYVAVRDTGEGIPPEKIAAIFEPFVQVGRAFNSPTAGTGLGLAISQGLARAMKGDLTVVSEPGAGSTFTLSLPIA